MNQHETSFCNEQVAPSIMVTGTKKNHVAPSLGLFLNFLFLLLCWFHSSFLLVSSLFFLHFSLFFVLCSFFILLVSCWFLSSFFVMESVGFEPRTSEVWSQNAVTELRRLLYIEGSKFPYISFI